MNVDSAVKSLTAHRPALKALTGIRFFAALHVVLFHTRLSQTLAEHGIWPAAHFIGNGRVAVSLFFLLSGFILAYTYSGQLQKPGSDRRFWEARFARLWPLYALSLLAMSIPGMNFPTPAIMVATLAMVQAWNPFDAGMAGAWNLVCWTLSAEAFFYLCFPVVERRLERLNGRELLWSAAALLALCVAVNSSVRTLGYESTGIFAYIPLPLVHLPEFFAGAGLGNYLLLNLGRRLPGAGAWTWLAATASLALLCTPTNPLSSLVIPAFAALIFGLASERTLLSRFLSTRAMLLGGGMSYAMYLMQMPAKSWGAGVAALLHRESAAWRMGLTLGLLLVVSLILFEVVEDPARRILRSAFATLEQNRTARRGGD